MISLARINQYYNELHEAQSFSGSKKELSTRRFFANLLDEAAKERHLRLVDEIKLPNLQKQPDGVLIDAFRFRYGYWEAKDSQDDLEKEIKHKISIGYPTDNLLVQTPEKAVLVRNGMWEHYDMTDARILQKLLTKFVAFEREEARNFREALLIFKRDLPDIAKVLKEMIAKTTGNPNFEQEYQSFFNLCKRSINPQIQKTDIDEMIIQHILTEEIFRSIFDNSQYHEENNVAQALIRLEKTFFVGDLKRQRLNAIKPYYKVIQAQAIVLQDHHEKQDFLKSIYESFYQAYNPKGADRLGIVYTPSEIVRFMIESTDQLLEKHFGKTLADKGVEILDPATGTGTFITDLIDYLPPKNLLYKFQNEIHANELSILPYYIANLNIEYIYNQKMGKYENFENLCWVDTLDNLAGMNKGWRGEQSGYETTGDIFNISEENTRRIKNQNEKSLTVIIGNPPYNANQQNENDNNKNRLYQQIDQRIKATFVKESAAQKTKLYDMYVRFYRWAMDRIDSKGMIAFVTNRSFIDSRTFDGFRKIVGREFSDIYLLDLQGDVRANDSKQGGNVFNIMTGVSLAFFVKNENLEKKANQARIYYYNIGDHLTGKEKIQFLKENKFQDLDFERIRPDSKGNWINQSETDFEELIPLIDKNSTKSEKQSIFENSSIGVNTARDEWVFDFDKANLEQKIKFFTQSYNDFLEKHLVPDSDKIWKNYLKKHQDKNGNGKNGNGKPVLVNLPEDWGRAIKWSESVKNYFLRNDFKKNKLLKFDKKKIISVQYRPFVRQFYYADQVLSDRLTQNHYDTFGQNLQTENYVICTSVGGRLPFSAFLVNLLPTFQFYVDPASCFPFYYSENGEKKENITDWALTVFREQYNSKQLNNLTDNCLLITKKDIFHYVYAILHKPEYRLKYELDLKREFPRIPLYDDFWKYAEIGRKLMELHLGYETINPFPLERTNSSSRTVSSKVILKAKKDTNEILITDHLSLKGVPAEAWEYKLGNRSAVEWVLDQYKPYKSDDQTIQEQFNTYDFAHYQDFVIDLLQKVVAVSLETVRLVKEL